MDILLDGNKASFQDSVATYPACHHVLTCRFLEKSLSWPGFAPQPPCQSSTNQACFYMENGIVHVVWSPSENTLPQLYSRSKDGHIKLRVFSGTRCSNQYRQESRQLLLAESLSEGQVSSLLP